MTSTWDIPDGYEAVIGGEIDVSEFTDLIVASQIAIDGSSPVTGSFVTMMLDAPGAHRDEGVLTLRETGSGTLAGVGLHDDPEPHVESVTSGWVHPIHLGRGLGSTIVRWGLGRAQSLLALAPDGARVTNRCQASDSDTVAASLFSDFGYTTDRHDIEMKLILDGPIAVSELPDGVALRTVRGDHDIESVARTTAEAFKDHYGWVERSWSETLERWANYRAMVEWDDDLVFIAESADGPVGALVGLRSYGSHLDVGFIASLGVLRPWRGRGLARSLLTTAFAEYQQRGMQAVALDVDGDNLTGATRLYESVGMKPVSAETSYLIELRPGRDMVKR